MSLCVMHMSHGAQCIHVQQEACPVMPHVVTHATNPNDIINTSHDMHAPAS